MRNRTFFILISFILCMVFVVNPSYAQEQKLKREPKGKREELSAKKIKLAPDFLLKDLSGNTVLLSSYRNKQPVLLVFWTTWCPYCLISIKKIKDLSAELKQSGIEALLINLDEPIQRVAAFVKKYNVENKVLIDKLAYVGYSYDVRGIPTFVLIGKRGDVLYNGNYFSLEEFKALLR